MLAAPSPDISTSQLFTIMGIFALMSIFCILWSFIVVRVLRPVLPGLMATVFPHWAVAIAVGLVLLLAMYALFAVGLAFRGPLTLVATGAALVVLGPIYSVLNTGGRRGRRRNRPRESTEGGFQYVHSMLGGALVRGGVHGRAARRTESTLGVFGWLMGLLLVALMFDACTVIVGVPSFF